MSASFSPPFAPLDQMDRALAAQGHVVMSPETVSDWIGLSPTDRQQLQTYWGDLPPDPHLKDGGRYRRRRHSSFVLEGDVVRQVPHRAHWQPLAYNALHGGMLRWFEPMDPAMVALPAWQRLLVALGGVTSRLRGERSWYVEAHPFRIDTTDGIGRPTPEGAHRDGVDLVAVFMLGRHNIKGGESRVFEAAGPAGQRFTLMQPWSLLLLDDERTIHETTPIQPEDPAALGWRDTLVITLRRDGFQDAV
jgi:hypothetical protein